MAQDHRIQFQRFELKYLARPVQAFTIRNFVRAHLELDDFGLGKPDGAYPIHSIYLDSDRLSLYWHTINGNKNRFKLRLRYYSDDPASPVYFEIKRRSNEAILKKRVAVRRAAVEPLLAGRPADTADLFKPEARALVELQEFMSLVRQYDASPKARVSYLREAWLSPHDNSLRVTMDRNVQCHPQSHALLDTRFATAPAVFGDNVVAEIKFTGRFPDWCGDLARFCGLTRGSAAKYAEGVNLAGQERFLQPGLPGQGLPGVGLNAFQWKAQNYV